ncbi:MAG: SDR family NAD(P)-dependent oxidoreductase [Reyranellaceae bacterium]
MRDPKSILITGASSGIGEALALEYAAPGTFLALTGRDAERLDGVAAAARARGAVVEARAIDVLDRAGMKDWLLQLDAAHPLDLAVANAGVGLEGDRKLGEEDAMRGTFAVNVEGVLNTVLPLLPAFRARRRGQIAVMASLASFVGLPQSAAYNGSKAAVRVWGESLRLSERKNGVEVSVICPGFVVSRMTARNSFRMPFLMSAEKAAGRIRRGLARNKARIAFPFGTKAAVWLGIALPASLTDRLMQSGSRGK